MLLHLTATVLCTAASVSAQGQNATANATATGSVNDKVGWVPSSGGRSTMNIVWSCLSILLVCTYKCLHLNIASFEQTRAGWHKIKGLGIPYWPEWSLISKYFRKIKWMAIILIAPEAGVVVAYIQYLAARKQVREAKLEFPEEELTLTHGFYAVSGGFALDIIELPTGRPSKEQDRVVVAPEASGIPLSVISPRESNSLDFQRDSRPSFDMENQDALLKKAQPSEEMDRQHDESRHCDSNLRNIDLATYVRFCKRLGLGQNSIITKEDINDRSKSDAFTKAFAIGQSTWLVVQSIARVYAGLPVSELELATMAYVLCAVAMYGIWWYKAFDVEHVTVVGLAPGKPQPEEYDAWTHQDEIGEDTTIELVFANFRSDNAPVKHHVVLYGIATIFSGIHIAAWNWEFPTPTCQTLWRICAVAATAAGPATIGASFFIILASNFFEMSEESDFNVWLFILCKMGILVGYVVARLGLIVLVFYSFTSMPAAMYETVDWTTYFPFLS